MAGRADFYTTPTVRLDTRYVNITGDTMTGMLSYQSSRSITDLYHVVDKRYVDEAVTALGARYYMIDTASGEADYKLCSLTASSDTEKSINGTDLADGDYIAGWISPNTNEPDKLIAGVYNWRVYAEKTGGTKTLRLYWKLVERKSDDSETVIGTSVVSNEITTGKNSYIIPLTLSADHEVASDSYVVGKLYADVSGGGNAPSVTLYYEGDSDSHWEIPVNTEILDNSYVNATGDTMTGALTITPSADGTSILNVTTAAGTSVLNVDTTNKRVGIGTDSPAGILDLDSGASSAVLYMRTDSGAYDARIQGYNGATIKFTAGYDESDDVVKLFYGSFAGGKGIAIDSSGDVGIGTTSPTSKLHLYGTTTQIGVNIKADGNYNSFMILDSGKTSVAKSGFWFKHAGTEQWRVSKDANNNFEIYDDANNLTKLYFKVGAGADGYIVNVDQFGLGTSSPKALLHLQSDTAATNVIFQQDVNTGSGFAFTFRKSRGTESSPSVVFNNDIVGEIAWKPYDGLDYISESGRIRVEMDGGIGNDDVPGRMTFWTTADGANSPTERMRINNAGDVAIGLAASASAQLHIDQSSATGAQPVLLLDQADVSEEFIKFVGSAAAGVLTQSIVNASDVTTATVAGYLRVYVQDDGDQITDQAYYVPIYTLS